MRGCERDVSSISSVRPLASLSAKGALIEVIAMIRTTLAIGFLVGGLTAGCPASEANVSDGGRRDLPRVDGGRVDPLASTAEGLQTTTMRV